MQNILNKCLELLSNNYVSVALVVIVIVLLYIFRQSKLVINIVGNAIIETEKKFNSESGQIKLDHAVETVQSKLPFILRIILTKYVIVSLIEYMLNFIGKAFKIDKEVDIKGNE